MRRALLFAASIALVFVIGCDPHRENRMAEIRQMTGGNPHAGRDKIRSYGCNTCHIIPGITGVQGVVGPPLEHWSRRVYIAGEFPNTPDNLTKWIQHPPRLVPKTAMPDMGVTEQDSRDIAAYLYSLN